MRPAFKRYIKIAIVFIVCISIGLMAGVVVGYFRSAPSLDEVTFNPELTSYIYDRHGTLIQRLYREHRVYLDFDEIPNVVQEALIATEDVNFYRHHGVDITGIIRAFYRNFKGEHLSGGSTITQQLAKNVFLTLDRTWTRKFKELLWTIQIERKYSKEEILERYLNEVYFGHGAYGVEAASQTFFGKPVSDVTLAEAALLVGVTKGPGYYSPLIDLDASRTRGHVVINRMVAAGYITAEEAEQAKAVPVEVIERTPVETKAPYFLEYVRQQLLSLYGAEAVFAGGLRVYTTLDLTLQDQAESVLQSVLSQAPVTQVEFTDRNELMQPQPALVALDPRNGHILAMVGGRGNDKYNRAVQAKRQPGSAMKPFVYVAAIESGYTPAHVMTDQPTQIRLANGSTWSPTNYDSNVYVGPVTLRKALEDSINTIAAQLIVDVGVKSAFAAAERMGITTLVDSGRVNDMTYAFALGGLTHGVTPLELASSYGVLANQGIHVEPISILRVEGPNGKVLQSFQPKKKVVLSEETSYIVTDMLRGVIERGTGRRAHIGRPAAGKTGTTSDFTNAWFVGYTPDLVTSVWLGNDQQQQPMVRGGVRIGSGQAAQIWGEFMRLATVGRPLLDFTKPDRVVTDVLIDTKTGLLVNPDCRIEESRLRYEIFIRGTEPKELSPACYNSFF